MDCIEKEVVEMLDGKLMDYIIEDTQYIIQNFEMEILKGNYNVFSKFNKFMERVQNVIELSFRYCNNPENTIPCDVARLLIDLTELKVTISKCDYDFEECDDFDEPQIIDNLGEFIADTLSGYLVERDYYFTTEDIETYKKKRIEEIAAEEVRSKKLEEEHQQYIAKKKDVVENWRKENLNKDFDFSVLSELEINILKTALETDLKSLSISWIQRKFAMGYCKAGNIIEHLEACGAVSTFEDVEELGLSKSGRIIRVSFE